MKQRQKTKPKKTAITSSKEPLVEGMVIPLNKHGHRSWASMSDDELYGYAMGIIKTKGIKNRRGLREEDNGLYQALYKRKLLNKIRFIKKRRNWASMSDEELVEYVRNFIEEKGIKSRKELRTKDNGLYDTLKKRKLFDRVGLRRLRRKRRNWASMEDEELIRFTKKYIKKEKIKIRTELKGMDQGLYHVLCKRKLLDRLGLEKQEYRSWVSMSDDEIIRFTNRVILDKEIEHANDLRKHDRGLFYVLEKRGIIRRPKFKKKRRRRRNWASMGDDEIIDYARRLMEEKGIKTRRELSKEDNGLYSTLLKRKLIDRLKFEERLRNWASMTDDELIEYSKEFIKEKGIRDKTGLKEEDGGLYFVLSVRKLINRVGLKDRIRPKGFFLKMTDSELIEHARRFMEENGIKTRSELSKSDGVLYAALGKRKLRDRIFARIERRKERQAVQDVFDALREFSNQ